MEEHLGYSKYSATGNNSGKLRNVYNNKTIISDYGESEIVIPRGCNGEFEPRVLGKRQTRTDELEMKIMAMYSKGLSKCDIAGFVACSFIHQLFLKLCFFVLW